MRCGESSAMSAATRANVGPGTALHHHVGRVVKRDRTVLVSTTFPPLTLAHTLIATVDCIARRTPPAPPPHAAVALSDTRNREISTLSSRDIFLSVNEYRNY